MSEQGRREWKALTVCQPYAHLIAIKEKPIENRTWPTRYRGPLMIHAGKSRDWLGDGDTERYPGMVFGAIVAVADLTQCFLLDAAWPKAYRHLQDHEHANGPYCFVVERVRRLAMPVPCSGSQGLWSPSDSLVELVERQLAEVAP